MKKRLFYGIIVVLIIVVIAIVFLLKTIRTDYDKISFISSSEYDSYSFLQLNDTHQYEIVDNQTRIIEILNSIKNDYDNTINTKEYENKYDEEFFKDNNLLIVVGEIKSKITKLTKDNNMVNVNVDFYQPNYDGLNGSYKVNKDGVWKFDLYFIQIDKDVNNITVYMNCLSNSLN